MTETRIRWHAPAESTIVAEFGYVGTLTACSLFQILKPVTRELSPNRFDEWGLVATFPGVGSEVRYAASRDKLEAVAELKAEAERWLSEFVSSLGAVFPSPRPGRQGRPRPVHLIDPGAPQWTACGRETDRSAVTDPALATCGNCLRAQAATAEPAKEAGQ
jgi:hypothetical protein